MAPAYITFLFNPETWYKTWDDYGCIDHGCSHNRLSRGLQKWDDYDYGYIITDQVSIDTCVDQLT